MRTVDLHSTLDLIRERRHELTGRSSELDPLIDFIGDRPFVLLGEATHGTHEFYDLRALLTERLIVEKGFNAVAVEADWPDAYRVNRYVRHHGDDESADDALADFERFPIWMWRNTVVVQFVRWLWNFNASRAAADRCGFYGLDLYSLYTSAAEVLHYLDTVDPEAALAARQRYGCLGLSGADAQRYGFAVSRGVQRSCADDVIEQVVELQSRRAEILRRDGLAAEDEQFFAEQNARVVQNAEAYYRQLFSHEVNTWNLRDSHMADTLAGLAEHLARHGSKAKIVVWAHNSHLGDARATEMGERGEHNLGQLTRQFSRNNCALVGFTTHEGSVAAASNWDARVERKTVRPSLPGSFERLFHDAGGNFLLVPAKSRDLREALLMPRLERAIGVIYRPETERWSHYFDARLGDQFDAVIHIDRTSALRPLEPGPLWPSAEHAADLPETYPRGL